MSVLAADRLARALLVGNDRAQMDDTIYICRSSCKSHEVTLGLRVSKTDILAERTRPCGVSVLQLQAEFVPGTRST